MICTFTLNFYGSPDYRNSVTRKFILQKSGFNKKKYSGHARYFLHFVRKMF